MNQLKQIAFATILSGAAAAAAAGDEARWLTILAKDAGSQGDLIFPAKPNEPGDSELRNAVFKPAGNGPFPALVLAHTCGGVRPVEMRYWVDAALKEGYAVLVVDSMRGNANNCFAPMPVPTGRRLKDLYDAAGHLSKLPFVDPARIAELGFSQGAIMAALLASPQAKQAVAPAAPRYAASAGLYGTCQWPAGSLRTVNFQITYLFGDSDRPLLYLMGDEDRETPAQYCSDVLPKLKDKGAPVEWNLYPGVTHCWDCSTMNGFSKVDQKGDRIVYRYDRAVTEDSRKRVFDFLSRRLQRN
jgi:dienelactone hydrolase